MLVHTGLQKLLYADRAEKLPLTVSETASVTKHWELVTKKAAEMQATDDCFFRDYEKSIKLVVLDGTENMDTIYQEIYGADIAGTAMVRQARPSALREMDSSLNPGSMYCSRMQRELLI